jgi:xanthine dehydrogenase large subunit
MNRPDPNETPLHRPTPHESARGHVTGRALYTDDLPPFAGELFGWPVLSTVAHGRLVRIGKQAALLHPGVVAVLDAGDVPGRNDVGPVIHDEPLFADGEVHYAGQIVALVIGRSEEAAREGAAKVALEIEPLPPVLDVHEAIARGSFLGEPFRLAKGDVLSALAAAPERLTGEVESGGQEHLYLETQAAIAIPGEADSIRVVSSTQHPTEIQTLVAALLGRGRHRVVVESPRMGGAFGGKESQGSYASGLAAVAAARTGKPVRVRFDRDVDGSITGKRHPWWSRFEAGYDRDGNLLALEVETFADGGWSTDLSRAILQRCLFHLDHAYSLPAALLVGRICRTNTASNTAFRGFGGPQGALVVEEALSRIAERLGKDPLEVRRRNFYGEPPRNETPYGQLVPAPRLERIASELSASSDYSRRRSEIDAANARSRDLRRGLAFSPVKFGISFTTAFLNQAGALVLVYADGTAQVNHGGTEMGQGLHTKMQVVAAHELGLPLDRIRLMTTSTEKVPNTSPTAASSGADMNGQAVAEACRTIRERLRGVAAARLGLGENEAAELVFAEGRISLPGRPDRSTTFAEVASDAHLRQVPLSATGFYRTPGIAFDFKTGKGTPFHYYAYGGAVTEIEISGLTGEFRLRRVDILHDAGSSLVPSIDRGQVEGGYVQGVGWLTTEELLRDGNGRLVTKGPSTYKIPAVGDPPEEFRVELLRDAEEPSVIHGSKAVGEPPLLLALSVVGALRHAIASFGPGAGYEVELRLPATPEAILRAVEAAKAAKG